MIDDIHSSCEDVWDSDFTNKDGPICEGCIDRLGKMDYYSGAGDW